jgi:hypothetical protein
MRERHHQSNTRTLARDLKTVCAGVGVDGPSAGDTVAQGALAPHSISRARSGNGVVARVATALADHGRLHALDRPSPGERDGTLMREQVDADRRLAWVSGRPQLRHTYPHRQNASDRNNKKNKGFIGGREGIEPPTRGFSVHGPKRTMLLK